MTITDLSVVVNIAGEYENFVLPVGSLGKFKGDIVYSIDRQKNTILLNSGIEQRIDLCVYEDYPLIDLPLKEAISLDLPIELLDALVNLKVFASTDETRYILTGVYIDKGGLVVTDGRRLVYREYDFSALGDRHFNIPPEALKVLSKIDTISETFKLQYSADENIEFVKFYIDDITVTVKLIDGGYPAWRQVIPADKILCNKLTFDRLELLGLLKQYVSVEKPKDRDRVSPVYFKFDETDTCLLSNEKNTVNLKLSVTKDIKQYCKLFSFNAYYLIDLLDNGFFKPLKTVTFEHDGQAYTAFLFRFSDGKSIILPRRL